MRIMVDIDGCIGDFVRSMAAWTARNKHVYHLQDPSTYAFHEDAAWSKAYHDGPSFITSLQQAVLDGVYLHEHTIPSSQSVIKALHDDGNEIIIATDRAFGNRLVDSIARRDTATWLATNGYHYDSLIITHEKENVNADVFIEDSPRNMKNIIRAGKPVVKIPHVYNVDAPCSATMPIWNAQSIIDTGKAS